MSLTKPPYIIDLASQDHDKLDGPTLAADGCTAIIARAEVGRVSDADYAKHRAVAIAAGLCRGAYFAPRWDLDMHDQAMRLFDAVGDGGPDVIPTIIDVEEGPTSFHGQRPPVVVRKLHEYVALAKARYKVRSGLYISARVVHEGLHDADLSDLAAEVFLHLARYDHSYFKAPPLPPGFTTWAIKQFDGDVSHVPGVTGRVDLNVLNPEFGTLRDWLAREWAASAAGVPR